jgi:hypothetical protein
VYSPSTPLVGPHVYLFNGAIGHAPFSDWDPVSPNNRCPLKNGNPNPECNYLRVSNNLTTNGFSNNQVQVIFLYDSTNYPTCDLGGRHCNDPDNDTPDAYVSEEYIGDIMRYLKQGYNGNPSRYPNLQQVFLISRNYGGYAKNPPNGAMTGCLSPEPFTYEEAFGVQRLAVAQIRQAFGLSSNDTYSGTVDYNNAPWFDWGPYLWASGNTPRGDLLVWCNNDSNINSPCFQVRDFRFGDASQGFYGDLTHPAHSGQGKAATQILNFLLQSQFTQAWIQQ